MRPSYRPVLLLGMAVAAVTILEAPAHAASRFRLGAKVWSTRASGVVYSMQNGTRTGAVDLGNDLAMGRHLNGGGYFVWRHDNPYLPDVRLGYDHVMTDGDTRLAENVTWDGTTYRASGRIHSQAELKSGRVVLFWNPVDNPVLDLRTGIEARWVSLNFPLSGTATRTSPAPARTYERSASGGGVSWLPLVNLGLTFHLPAGLDLVAAGSYLRYAGNYVFDSHAGLDYRVMGLVLSAGWRRLRLHLDDSSFSVNGDVEFKGVYAGLGLSF